MALTRLRFLSILLLTFILIVSAVPYTVTAAGSSITVTVVSTDTDGEYHALVSITNNPGVSIYNLALDFDNNAFCPVSIEQGDDLSGGMVFASNLLHATSEYEKEQLRQVTAVWGAASDIHGDGTLFIVTFRAKTLNSTPPKIVLVMNRIISDENDITELFSFTEIDGTVVSNEPDTYEDTNILIETESYTLEGSEEVTETIPQEPFTDGSIIGNPYTPDDVSGIIEDIHQMSIKTEPDPSDKSSSFGKVPQTGVQDITWYFVALIISILASTTMWVLVFQIYKEYKRN